MNGLDAADQDDQIGEDERRRRQNLTELDKRVEARCIWVMHRLSLLNQSAGRLMDNATMSFSLRDINPEYRII